MKIYIPKHLRKIKLIDMMVRMIQKYQVQTEVDSFSDFQYILKTDPVRKFLDLIYVDNESDELKKEETRKNKINYLASLFYSVKGTYKVLDYITAFGILTDWYHKDNTTKITYTIKSITVDIDSIDVDKDIFCEYFEDFFNALLYFKELTININRISTVIEDNTITSLDQGDVHYFQQYDADAREE